MIEVFILGDNKYKHQFKTAQMALRFMYSMKSKGYMVQGWSCDDPEDNEWLNRRFKL